jgi:hypothetical protein
VALRAPRSVLHQDRARTAGPDLQLEPLERLLDVGIAFRLDACTERAQRALEPQIVLIERPEAPGERRLERRDDDVEEDAVAFETEAARVRVLADEQVAGTCASACTRSRVIVRPCSTAPSSTRSICPIW